MDKVAESVFPDVTLTDLSQIRQFMRTTADTNGYPSAAIDELIVAVNEALSNIVRHSYQNKPGAIKVSMVCSQGAVKVTLHDNGPGFDPTSVPTPDTTLPLEKRPFGGLFIFSGGLMGPQGSSYKLSFDLQGMSIFIGCSDIDFHIPLSRVEETATAFKQANANVTKRIYPNMGHTINQDEIDQAQQLVANGVK